ncbi:RHS repeat-associated core domain-containing protein [Cytobacillus spongiae]|uniref:RHS repeat-associated core domain-containing protein n=1 Tax=Cytobacillus spongiae TaxID=2901381 RepID=UPI003D7AEE4C
MGDKTFQNDVKFTGTVQDTSTGLHYMNSRYYSSDTGRFISQDTYSGNVFDPWTQHLYTYTSNNPINFVDPTGHYHVDPDGNKILPTGKYIAAPSQPSTSYRSTPSSHKQSKPSAQRAKAKVQAKSSGSSSKRRSMKNWVGSEWPRSGRKRPRSIGSCIRWGECADLSCGWRLSKRSIKWGCGVTRWKYPKEWD